MISVSREEELLDPNAQPDAGEGRSVVYCVIPRALAPKLHDLLLEHFADDPSVRVVVERRSRERRSDAERRLQERPRKQERRHVRNAGGRRVEDRRGVHTPLEEPPPLPRKAGRYADRLTFVERREPTGQREEDADTARLVTRIQAGESELFGTIYTRYFGRVYSYLRAILRDHHEAEDVTQDVFVELLRDLPRYERRDKPFRAWMFAVVRNRGLDELEKRKREIPVDPEELARELESEPAPEEGFDDAEVLGWLSDSDLSVFVERLPETQRRVLVLSFLFELTNPEIAETLETTEQNVRALQSRALRFLRDRLIAIGRTPRGGGDRTRSRTLPGKAPVVRLRRFSLLSNGPTR